MSPSLRRTLTGRLTRASAYLALGIVLFAGVLNAFHASFRQMERRDPDASRVQAPAEPIVERYVAPADVIRPFY